MGLVHALLLIVITPGIPLDILSKREHIGSQKSHMIKQVFRAQFTDRFGQRLYVSITYTSLLCQLVNLQVLDTLGSRR
jgi:hypothetical protein